MKVSRTREREIFCQIEAKNRRNTVGLSRFFNEKLAKKGRSQRGWTFATGCLTVEHSPGVRSAKILALLALVVAMGTTARADDGGFSAPQHISEPIVVRVPEGRSDWKSTEVTKALQVFVGGIDPCCEGRAPIAGSYELGKKNLTFTPAFTFIAGQDYVARARFPGLEEKLVGFNIPRETSMIEARVTDTYPSGNVLPENTLRFYFHFSIPMAPHLAFEYIKLYDSAGTADEAAFMRFKQELWSEDRTRLTVLIDPGRIKRDVATHLELGPALRAGHDYTLSVDEGWPSADGASFLPAFSKSFRVGAALRMRPDVKFWRAKPPCLGTRGPLEVTFDRPFDRHLLSQDVHVSTLDGEIIDGTVHIGEGETSWTFTPREPWSHETVEVVANIELEDVAGNNFREALDQPVGARDSIVPGTALTVVLENCPSGLAGNPMD